MDALLEERDTTPGQRRLVEVSFGRVPAVQFHLELGTDDRTTPGPPCRLDDYLELLDLNGFSETIRQIAFVASGDESDEYGVLRPTPSAMKKTLEVLARALNAIIENSKSARKKFSFPRGSVTTDESGGIRIEWSRPAAAVHLVIAAEVKVGRSYIYHERGGEYGADNTVTGGRLASWLKLLD